MAKPIFKERREKEGCVEKNMLARQKEEEEENKKRRRRENMQI